jgi:hypothetical protein
MAWNSEKYRRVNSSALADLIACELQRFPHADRRLRSEKYPRAETGFSIRIDRATQIVGDLHRSDRPKN